MPLNIPMLRRIQAHILEEPRRLNMSTWGKCGLEPGDEIDRNYEQGIAGGDFHCLTPQSCPPCGTAGCLAGWTVMLEALDRGVRPYFGQCSMADVEAVRILGLDAKEAPKLFYPDNWDSDFWSEYKQATTPLELADITSRYIDWFIENYEVPSQ